MESIDAHLTYAVSFSTQRVETLLQRIAEAVNCNWDELSDEFSDSALRYPLTKNYAELPPPDEAMRKLYGDSAPQLVPFSFSPLSYCAADLVIGGKGEEHFSCLLSFSGRLMYEGKGERNQVKMTREWQMRANREGLPNPWASGPPRDDSQYEDWHDQWFEYEHMESIGEGNRIAACRVICACANAFELLKCDIDPKLKCDLRGLNEARRSH